MRHVSKILCYDASEHLRSLGRKGLAAGCRVAGSDCGGHSLLFTAIVRANGIPARKIIGQISEVNLDMQKYLSIGKGLTAADALTQAHVRAEFYSKEARAWVPVETTDKTDPLRLFGCDPVKPFLVKGFSTYRYNMPLHPNVILTGVVQTYNVIPLRGGKASHSFLAWDVQELGVA